MSAAPKDAEPLYILYFLPFLSTVMPGVSAVPEKRNPLKATDAPAARALTTSPDPLMPPSAHTGTPASCATFETSITAVSCGTPDPVTILVMHVDPGPTPTLTASTSAEIRSFAASAVAIFPATICMSPKFFLKFLTVFSKRSECP